MKKQNKGVRNMKNRIKELEKQITEMVENFQPNHFKEKGKRITKKDQLCLRKRSRTEDGYGICHNRYDT